MLGSFMFYTSGQILATFSVDIIVGAIQNEPAKDLPPFEYSWGMKHWGRMNEELIRASVGLLVLSIGHLLLLPPVIMIAKGLRKAATITAMVLIGLSALLFIMVPLSMTQAFGDIAVSGAVDPVAYGEMMSVSMNFASKCAILVAESIIVLLSVSLLFPSKSRLPTLHYSGKLVLTLLSGLCLLLFALPFLNLSFGPLSQATSALLSDPAELASHLSVAVRWMIFSSVMLGVSALLGLISIVMPNRAQAITPPSE